MKSSITSLGFSLLQLVVLALAADRIPSELSAFFTAKEPLHALFGDFAVSGPTKNVLENQIQVMPDLVVSSRMPYKSPFLFMIVDPDTASTTGSEASLSVTLHTLVSALTGESYYAVNQSRLAPSAADVLARYISPMPALTGPSHNYTLLLFAQPSSLAISSDWQAHLSATTLAGRANFPLGQFVEQLGLGQPICAMYFRLKEQTTTTTAPRQTHSKTKPATLTPTSTGTATISGVSWPSSNGTSGQGQVHNGTIRTSGGPSAFGNILERLSMAYFIVAAVFVVAA